MNKVDYKKLYKDIYQPKTKPELITVPPIQYVVVEGQGDPNTSEDYQEAIRLLYGLSYTIKMSKMTNQKIEGYFEYVVPPLEGFWWSQGETNVNYEHKENFEWISLIRQPEFVTEEVFAWACEEVQKKKGLECKRAKFREIEEGLCVQMLHVGSYDDEPQTIAKMEQYIKENGLKSDIGNIENGFVRRHHEIYLSDPRRTKMENLKTVIRIPMKEEK